MNALNPSLPKTAILLCAGRGERLRPLTDTVPKPLCSVHGLPLIAYHLQHLSQAGFKRVIINHAYLGDQIRRYVGDGHSWKLNVLYSPEPPGALETGGGIYAIIRRFGLIEPFITVNADIFCDYPYAKLTLPKDSLAHLVLVPNPTLKSQGDFGLTEEGFLSEAHKTHTVAGIIAYNPELWCGSQPGRYSVVPLIKRAMTQNKVTGEIYRGKWWDLGSIEQLNEANSR